MEKLPKWKELVVAYETHKEARKQVKNFGKNGKNRRNGKVQKENSEGRKGVIQDKLKKKTIYY